MKVIITNDDFGLSYGFTDAVRDCYLKGITTNTCIRTNGVAYDYAVRLLKSELKGIGVGIHLNLTQGKPHTKKIINSSSYGVSYLEYIIRTILNDKRLLKKIELELEEQFRIVIQKSKLRVDHVNGHDHIHMIPEIFEIVCKLCRKYSINCVRVSDEPFTLTKNFAKLILLQGFAKTNWKTLKRYNLKSADAYFGIAETSNIDQSKIKSAIETAKSHEFNTIEITSHPAIVKHKKDVRFIDNFIAKYANLPGRTLEYNSLLDAKLKNWIEDNGITLTNFKEL